MLPKLRPNMSEMKNAQNAFTNHTDEFISILLEAIQREKNKMKREQSRAAENRKNAQKCFFFHLHTTRLGLLQITYKICALFIFHLFGQQSKCFQHVFTIRS